MVAYRVKCETQQHLSRIALQVIESGGEGIVLRKPHSFYKSGRSQSLLKLKVFASTLNLQPIYHLQASRGDKEALVTDIDDSELLLQT